MVCPKTAARDGCLKSQENSHSSREVCYFLVLFNTDLVALLDTLMQNFILALFLGEVRRGKL